MITFEVSIIFWGSWAIAKTDLSRKPSLTKLSLSKSLIHMVYCQGLPCRPNGLLYQGSGRVDDCSITITYQIKVTIINHQMTHSVVVAVDAMLPVCNLVCCWTCESCLNLRGQYEHLYGFSPVWTRMCCTSWNKTFGHPLMTSHVLFHHFTRRRVVKGFTWWFDENAFKHWWHWCGLTSRPLADPAPPPPPPAPPWCPWRSRPCPKCMAAVFVIRYWKKEEIFKIFCCWILIHLRIYLET